MANSLSTTRLSPLAHQDLGPPAQVGRHLTKIRFLYFDMGNVLLHFDHRQACRQMGEVAGVPAERIWDIVFATDLELRYEAGEFTDREFYEILCEEIGHESDFGAMLKALSQIFKPNYSIIPLVAALDAAGYRMGVLSNTCPGHWAYCTSGCYGLLSKAFDVYALSYELGACKPAAKIYEDAARLAGVPPEEIFFVDDVAEHVTAALAAGFDAIQYTTTAMLADALRNRGLQFNY